MELIARNFESFPARSSAHRLFEPLIAGLCEVRFPVTVGQRNSHQITYSFDSPLEAALLAQGATRTELDLPRRINQRYDFAFLFGGKTAVVEVEKANWKTLPPDGSFTNNVWRRVSARLKTLSASCSLATNSSPLPASGSPPPPVIVRYRKEKP